MDILMKGIAAMMVMLFGALILTSLLAFELDRQASLGPDEADGTPAAETTAREASLPPHSYGEVAR